MAIFARTLVYNVRQIKKSNITQPHHGPSKEVPVGSLIFKYIMYNKRRQHNTKGWTSTASIINLRFVGLCFVYLLDA